MKWMQLKQRPFSILKSFYSEQNETKAPPNKINFCNVKSGAFNAATTIIIIDSIYTY